MIGDIWYSIANRSPQNDKVSRISIHFNYLKGHIALGMLTTTLSACFGGLGQSELCQEKQQYRA